MLGSRENTRILSSWVDGLNANNSWLDLHLPNSFPSVLIILDPCLPTEKQTCWFILFIFFYGYSPKIVLKSHIFLPSRWGPENFQGTRKRDALPSVWCAYGAWYLGEFVATAVIKHGSEPYIYMIIYVYIYIYMYIYILWRLFHGKIMDEIAQAPFVMFDYHRYGWMLLIPR